VSVETIISATTAIAARRFAQKGLSIITDFIKLPLRLVTSFDELGARKIA
jgi:hypothetical protein